MRTARDRRRGFTLLECLIYCALFSMLAVGTMRVVGESRLVRSNARDRTQLAVIAQTELDRLRTEPAANRKPGVQKLSRPEWPKGTQLEIETKGADGGLLHVEIRARRESIEGKPTVNLATVIAGAQP
jgi:type II secretion system protein I